jgi:hypothetical protein
MGSPGPRAFPSHPIIGFSDVGFEMPALNVIPIYVDVDETGFDTGELIRNSELSATSFNAEMRRIDQRPLPGGFRLVDSTSEKWAVWCNLNDEQDELEDVLEGRAVSVRGADREEWKTKREQLWRIGDTQAMITKGSIFGHGYELAALSQPGLFPDLLFRGLLPSYSQVLPLRPKEGRELLRGSASHGSESHAGTAAQIRPARTDADTHEVHPRKYHQTISRNYFNDEYRNSMRCQRAVDALPWRLRQGGETAGIRLDWVLRFLAPVCRLVHLLQRHSGHGELQGLEDFMIQFGYLIDELGRITMPGRECAVHCCDLLSTKWKDGAIGFKDFSGAISTAFRSRGWQLHSRITIWKDPVTEMQRTKAHGLLYKTLQKDSAASRVGAPDYLLVFRKAGENPKPITHNPESLPLSQWQELASPVWMTVDQGNVLNGELAREDSDERHICPLQLDVINRALTLWSAPDDLVFSPFTGIGSEGYCALKMGRRFVGSELKQSYFERACMFLKQAEQEQHMDLFAKSYDQTLQPRRRLGRTRTNGLR